MQFLIIGGSDAGIAAALRAREVDTEVQIKVILADGYPNFSICGLPFFLSGETPDWHQLAHRTEFKGIDLLLWHTATAVDPDRKIVRLVNRDNRNSELPYDRLLIATGAVPFLPDIPGLLLPGVHVLHTVDNSLGIQKRLHEANPQSVIIVGAGYIGVEMADAFVHRGLDVTLVGRSQSVLDTVDPELGKLIANELRCHDIDVRISVDVGGVFSSTCLRVVGSNGFEKAVGFGARGDRSEAGIRSRSVGRSSNGFRKRS
jgi:NADPH-dependent 2,4-dienoyl-CoA reductase/sulfur reductase-like enzyme